MIGMCVRIVGFENRPTGLANQDRRYCTAHQTVLNEESTLLSVELEEVAGWIESKPESILLYFLVLIQVALRRAFLDRSD